MPNQTVHSGSMYLGNEGRGGISFNPTPEQNERFTVIASRPQSSLWDFGFIDPKQIVSYNCDRCDVEKHKPPRVISSINLQGERVVATVGYQCTDCDRIVYHGFIENAIEIPSQFIDFDETGNFKTPTPKSIDDYLVKIEQDAKEGDGRNVDDFPFSDRLEVLQRWASKIGYPLPTARISIMKSRWRNAYLLNLEQEVPELVTKILESRDYAFSLRCGPEDECSAFTGDGLSDRVDRLFQAIRHARLPSSPELRGHIIEILDLYLGMFREERDYVVQEIKSLEERLRLKEVSLSEASLEVNTLRQKL